MEPFKRNSDCPRRNSVGRMCARPSFIAPRVFGFSVEFQTVPRPCIDRPANLLCTSVAGNKQGLNQRLWSQWRFGAANRLPMSGHHHFSLFCVSSGTGFRKQDMAIRCLVAGFTSLLQISTAICFYDCLCFYVYKSFLEAALTPQRRKKVQAGHDPLFQPMFLLFRREFPHLAAGLSLQ